MRSNSRILSRRSRLGLRDSLRFDCTVDRLGERLLRRFDAPPPLPRDDSEGERSRRLRFEDSRSSPLQCSTDEGRFLSLSLSRSLILGTDSTELLRDGLSCGEMPNLILISRFAASTSELKSSLSRRIQKAIHSGLKSCAEASLPSACSSLYRRFQNASHSAGYSGCFSGCSSYSWYRDSTSFTAVTFIVLWIGHFGCGWMEIQRRYVRK